MKTILKHAAPLVLGLAFLGSVATTGCAVRYYDADHRDYHRWDAGEDRAYRAYWTENHSRDPYRDYGKLNAGEQHDYWNWRHGHPDAGKGNDRNKPNDKDKR